MDIAVVALGKIGLPLAVQYATKGHHVVGIDIDSECVDKVNQGMAPFPGEAGLAEHLSRVVASGHLRATTDYASGIPHAAVVVLVVPLLVEEGTHQPDFQWMDAAVESLAEHMSRGTLVIFETTLPVGTTRSRWKPVIERRTGMEEGVDFSIAFSPERVLTGRVFADLRRYPKLFGALNSLGTERTRDFYEAVLDFDVREDLATGNGVWDLGSPEAAELAKLAETTYRDVNIALANQFAMHAEDIGVDIYRVIDAANSQPYSHIHQPGVAVGGHCIPVYPRLYLAGDPHASVVSTARTANETMPRHAVNLLENAIEGGLTGRTVVVLGAAYRGGVKETAVSGVFPLVTELTVRGAVPLVHDPLYTDQELTELGLSPYHLGQPADAAILHSNHREYAQLTAQDLPGAKVVVDGRHMLAPSQLGDIPVVSLGDGTTTGNN